MNALTYTGRFFKYLLSRIIILGIAAAFVVLSFFVCMDYMNVNILIRDGFYKRAATVMQINGDPSILVKVFTKSFIDKDTLLSSHEYDDYIIRGFNHKLDVDFKLIFPWDRYIQIDITEKIPDIDGELPSEEEDDSAKSIQPPLWQDARYRLTLARDEDNWRITGMELLEKLPKPVESPSQTPASGSAQPSAANSAVLPGTSASPSTSK